MNGASFIGLIYISLLMLGMGLGNAAQIMIARRNGEHHYEDAGKILANSFYLAIIISFVEFIGLRFVIPSLLDGWIQSAEIRDYANRFLIYRSYSFFFYTLTFAITSFWSGIAQTRILAYSTIITAVLNVILEYAMVFGHFGIPAMGIEGGALATLIAEGTAFVFVMFYTFRHETAKTYQLAKAFLKVPMQYSVSLMKLGGPIMIQLVLSLGVWAIFFLFIEKLGEKQFQASMIIRSMYSLVWISAMGFSTAAKTYVSTLIAEHRQADLAKTIKRIMVMNLVGIFVLSHGLWLYPTAIAQLFTSDLETIEYTVTTMRIIFPAMYIFAFTSILLATVEGSGNTVAGAIVEFATMTLYILFAWYITVKNPQPIHIVWTADYLYFICIGLFSWYFLRDGKWKYKVV
jgi:multidrug resistance protein, MATE family